MNVVWSDEAAFALLAIEEKLAERYTVEKAATIIDTLVRRIAQLEQHAHLGRAVPEYGHPQLRELVDNWNRVIYRVGPDAIEIVAVVPARMPLDAAEPEND